MTRRRIPAWEALQREHSKDMDAWMARDPSLRAPVDAQQCQCGHRGDDHINGEDCMECDAKGRRCQRFMEANMENSLEQQVADFLTQQRIDFTRPDRTPGGGRLDFYLPAFKLYIEVKQHPTERLHDQMESCGNGASILVICGPDSVKRFLEFDTPRAGLDNNQASLGRGVVRAGPERDGEWRGGGLDWSRESGWVSGRAADVPGTVDQEAAPEDKGGSGTVNMWEAHLKLKFIGTWWKISLLCNLAKWLRLETKFYSGGSGRGEFP